jgi:hypothetical protein
VEAAERAASNVELLERNRLGSIQVDDVHFWHVTHLLPPGVRAVDFYFFYLELQVGRLSRLRRAEDYLNLEVIHIQLKALQQRLFLGLGGFLFLFLFL